MFTIGYFRIIMRKIFLLLFAFLLPFSALADGFSLAALLIYTARGFNGSLLGKYGLVEKFTGMCLETMHFADSPNQERFPSTVLRPGQTFRSTTQWRFYTLDEFRL